MDNTDMDTDHSLDIYLVEDSAILRDRLVESLASWGGTRIVGQADTEAAANVGLLTEGLKFSTE